MKKLIILTLVILGTCYGCSQLKKVSDKEYAECMASGSHSHDTCYYYAYVM